MKNWVFGVEWGGGERNLDALLYKSKTILETAVQITRIIVLIISNI